MLEIERKFLVRTTKPEPPLRGSIIRQGYLVTGNPELRVRDKNGEFCLTLKRGQGLAREEVEEPVNALIGEVLLVAARPRVISKIRVESGRWEIDYYADTLNGLVIAEVELSEESERLPPVPSDIHLGREVTHDPRFKNQSLACLLPAEARIFVEEALRGDSI